MTYEDLKRGDAIRVAYGSRGSQIAIVHDRTRSGNVRAYKYSATQRRWKGPLRIWPHELISRVDERDLRNLPNLPEA